MRALLTVLLLAIAAPASAEEAASEATEAARAIEKAAEARAHYDRGEWATALELFREAETLYHSPVLVLYQARALRNLDRLVEAEAMYRSLVDEAIAPDAPEPWRQAQRDAAADVASLDIPSLSIRVSGAAAARVTIDGVEVAAGAPVEIDPGAHQVVATAGERREEKTVTLARGQSEELSFDLSPVVRPTVATAEPRAMRRPRAAPAAASAGPEESGVNVPAMLMTVVGGAALAAGAIVGAAALGEASAAQDALPSSCHGGVCPSTERARVEAEYGTAVDLAGVADGLILGGALLATAGVLWWVFGSLAGASPEPAAGGWALRF